jgi:hypothetical protein
VSLRLCANGYRATDDSHWPAAGRREITIVEDYIGEGLGSRNSYCKLNVAGSSPITRSPRKPVSTRNMATPTKRVAIVVCIPSEYQMGANGRQLLSCRAGGGSCLAGATA